MWENDVLLCITCFCSAHSSSHTGFHLHFESCTFCFCSCPKHQYTTWFVCFNSLCMEFYCKYTCMRINKHVSVSLAAHSSVLHFDAVNVCVDVTMCLPQRSSESQGSFSRWPLSHTFHSTAADELWADWLRIAAYLITSEWCCPAAQSRCIQKSKLRFSTCTFSSDTNQCQCEHCITSMWHLPHQIKSINRLEQVQLQCLISLSQRDLTVVMETWCESTKEVTDNIDMTNLFFLISAPCIFFLFAILFVSVTCLFE